MTDARWPKTPGLAAELKRQERLLFESQDKKPKYRIQRRAAGDGGRRAWIMLALRDDGEHEVCGSSWSLDRLLARVAERFGFDEACVELLWTLR